MRLMHTSDWHLGRTVVGGHSRSAEFEAVLTEITAIAQEVRPDLILHTGDLFDRAQPAGSDLAMGARALVNLARIAPTVIIAGNHDSVGLFDALNSFATAFVPILDGEPARLQLVHTLPASAETAILDFPTRDDQRIRVAPLPFIHRNRVYSGFAAPEDRRLSYADRLREIQRELLHGLHTGYRPDQDVLVFGAHLFVESAIPSWSERPLDITQDYASAADALPNVAYSALGHIHRPQEIRRAGVVARYAGSPLQLDFGEEGEVKSVVVVEADPGRPARVETIALTSGRRLMTFTGDLKRLAMRAADFENAYVKAVIDVDGPTPGLADLVAATLSHSTIVEIHERPAGWEEAIQNRHRRDDGPEPDLSDMFSTYLAETDIAPYQADLLQAAFNECLSFTDRDEPAPDDPVESLLHAALSTSDSWSRPCDPTL